jgi:putative ABC transport system permease protein
MAQLVRDARFALRMFRKRWGITAIALVSLAIAIGGNTAVFSLVSAVLLQPTSVVEPARVVLVQERLKTQSLNLSNFSVSEGTLADLRERSRTTAKWAGYRVAQRGLRGSESSEPITVAEVSPGFFELVGAPLRLGRGFHAEEGRAGGPHVAVVRPEYWLREHGDADPLGQILMLDGEPHEVVGVLPEDFNVLFAPADVWVPMIDDPGQRSRDSRTIVALARLAPGATQDAFRAEVDALAGQLEAEHPQAFSGWTLDAFNYRDDIPSTQTRIFYGLLQGSVFFVLLIACANVTNLLLARGQERQREIAVRLTLGAGRGRIVRQLLTESTLLVAGGTLLGLGLGWYGIRLIVNRLTNVLPPNIGLELDGRVLLFTVLIACVTGLAFGLAPALQTFRNSQAAAVQSGSGRSSATRGRRMLSRTLVVAEIALSLVALGGGGTLIQGFLQLRGGEPGFDPTPILTTRLRIPQAKYATDEQTALLLDQVLDGVAAIEGVEASALANALPRGFGTPTATFQLRGQETEEGAQAPRAYSLQVTPGYFDTIGIELLRGRTFARADRLGQAPVAVVNRAFVDTWLAGGSPLGQYVEIGGVAREIVGVVEDIQQVLLQTGSLKSETIYAPAAQTPAGSYRLALRARGGDPGMLAEPLRAAVRELDPDLTLGQVLTLNEVTEQNFAGIDVFSAILGGFGALAILLASLGNYGVLAYSVSGRRNEIGIRMALGAEGRSVVWMVARQGVTLAVIGLALGGLLMVPLMGVIRSILAGIATVSSGSVTTVAGVLFAVTVVASLVPAVRAASVNPVTALRQD